MDPEALPPKKLLRFEGEDAVRAAAEGDDLSVLRQFRQPRRKLLERHVERARSVAEQELVFWPYVEDGHGSEPSLSWERSCSRVTASSVSGEWK